MATPDIWCFEVEKCLQSPYIELILGGNDKTSSVLNPNVILSQLTTQLTNFTLTSEQLLITTYGESSMQTTM